MFTLDPRLQADSTEVCTLDNVQVRLMNDARYWWLVLVPEVEDAVEWHHLEPDMQHRLFELAVHSAGIVEELAAADKMNIAALGNMVRQLHVHVIARHEGDAAWPGPVWGVGESLDYEVPIRATRTQSLQALLQVR
ncbi:MAG TPA: diadenosine tetraphosphate hydrolase [Rhodobiaceae bacterium]|nr:diadenosine tetraphosphate hydrolase [Rhodobiaceae bacterium]